MKTKNYKGYEITKTNTTTDITRQAFGNLYQTIGYVHRISDIQEYACSFAACKRIINEAIEYKNWVNSPEFDAEVI